MTPDLLIDRHEDVTILTLNRPAKFNALSDDLVESLSNAVFAAGTDGTRLLVVKGSGKGFCGGFDLSDIDLQSDGDLLGRLVRVELALQALYHAPCVTLGLAHGRSFGAGADIICCCVRRVAAPGTTFKMPGLRFGVALGTKRLANVIGMDKARYVLGSTREFGEEEALSLGFVTDIRTSTEWGSLIEETLRKLCDLPRESTSRMLELTRVDTRDSDMSALIRSAANKGLRERIVSYAASIRGARDAAR